MNIEAIKFLNQLKNSSSANKKKVKIKPNRLIRQIICSLYQEGYILSYKLEKYINNVDYITVTLRDFNSQEQFKSLKICSSPSKTLFVTFQQITKLNMNKNLYIFSTNKGLLSGNTCKKKSIGGVLLFYC